MAEFLCVLLLVLAVAWWWGRRTYGFLGIWPLGYQVEPEVYLPLVARREMKDECHYIIDAYRGLDVPGVVGHEQTMSRVGRWPDGEGRLVHGKGWWWLTSQASRNLEVRFWKQFIRHLQRYPLQAGARVYLPAPILNCVYEELLAHLSSPISLVVTEGAEPPLNQVLDALVRSEWIEAVYVSNVELTWQGHEKVRYAALGIRDDDRFKFSALGVPMEVSYRHPAHLRRYLATSGHFAEFQDPATKPARVLCALGNTGSKWTDESIRRRAREYLAARPDLAHVLTERVGPFEYFRMHRDFAFEISPPGNGLDCHRHWENIYLGTIPIVFSSPKDDFHRRFPMVIIEDLDEITPENLERWRGEHAPYWDPELRWLTRLYDDAIPWRRTAP